MKKLFSLFVAVLFAGSMFALNASITFSEEGLTNGTQYKSFEVNDHISLAFGDGGNDGKYYNTGAAIRVYGGGHMTVTAAEGYTITEIALTFGSGDNTNAITTDKGTYSDGTWTGAEESVIFTVGGTNGHRRIATVAVTYNDGEGPAVAKPSITGETPFFGATTVTIACTTTGASIYYTLDGSEPSATSLAYTEPFSLNETDTVKAIAVLGEDVSEIAEKIFNNRAYASFEDLIAAELDNHTIVEVSFSKLEIDSFYVSGSGENAKRKGIYFTLNETAYEIYFNKGDEVVPAAWAVGGKVSGTIRGDWYEYTNPQKGIAIWEIVPQDNAWVWTSLTYEATPTAIDNTDAAVKAVKAIENGKLIIIKNGVRFDATGARL